MHFLEIVYSGVACVNCQRSSFKVFQEDNSVMNLNSQVVTVLATVANTLQAGFSLMCKCASETHCLAEK